MLGYAFSLPNLVGAVGSDLTKKQLFRSIPFGKVGLSEAKGWLEVLVFSGSANCIFSEATEIYIYI